MYKLTWKKPWDFPTNHLESELMREGDTEVKQFAADKLPTPNRRGSSSNHHFSEAMFNFGGVNHEINYQLYQLVIAINQLSQCRGCIWQMSWVAFAGRQNHLCDKLSDIQRSDFFGPKKFPHRAWPTTPGPKDPERNPCHMRRTNQILPSVKLTVRP